MSTHEPATRRMRAPLLVVIGLVLLALFGGFSALGIWQLHRMSWKQELIARVDSRIHADPVAAPARADWPLVSRERDEYRRVRLEGTYLPQQDTRVLAVTGLGSGYWVLSPLRTTAGALVLVNRGFVPDKEQAAPVPAGPVQISGLLRINEPDGGFLRRNAPGEDRWYSRDVAAIAAARGLSDVAPFFVDAERAAADAPRWPAGGMTVVHFRDHHLSYALTWFALAALVAYAAWRLVSAERRLRQHACILPPSIHADAGHPIRRD